MGKVPTLKYSSLAYGRLFRILSALRYFYRFVILATRKSTSVPFPIASRSGSKDGRRSNFVRRIFDRFFRIYATIKCLTPRRRTCLIFIMNTARNVRSFSYRLATITMVHIITIVPILLYFRNDNNYRLRNARRATISITLCFRCPLRRINVQNGRTSAPSQRIITFTRKVRFCTTLFNAQGTRSTSKVFIRSRAMKIIICSSSILTTYRIRRFPMRFQYYIHPNKRVKVINPRRFCATRIRPFRLIRIKRPTIFFFRIVIRSLNARGLTW